MGFFDGLKSFDEDVKNVTGGIVDNDAFSVQDTIRGGLEATTGAGDGHNENDGDETQFAVDSARFFDQMNQNLASHGKWFAEATDGTALDEGAVGTVIKGGGMGLQGGYDLIVQDAGAIAYGTATGANLRGTKKDPTRATDGYAPGALDTGEIALTLGTGGAGGVAAKGGSKVLAKIPKALSKVPDALRGASKGSDEAADTVQTTLKWGDETSNAADDTVETAAKTGEDFIPGGDGGVGSLKLPDHLAASPAKGSIDLAKRGYAATPYKKSMAAIAGIGVAGHSLGFGDLLSGPLPDGYVLDHEYVKDPGGKRIKQIDEDGNLLGYWVSVGTDGEYHKILTAGVGSRDFGTSKVIFPAATNPSFASEGQANAAYYAWASAQNDPSSEGDPSAKDQEDQNRETKQGQWGEAAIVRKLNYGWYLAEQKHRQKEKSRFFVVGATQDGTRLYLDAGGGVQRSPTTFGTMEGANAAYQSWVSNGGPEGSGTAPDPNADRPRPSDLVADLRNSLGGGVLNSLTTNPILGGLALGLIGLLAFVIISKVA